MASSLRRSLLEEEEELSMMDSNAPGAKRISGSSSSSSSSSSKDVVVAHASSDLVGSGSEECVSVLGPSGLYLVAERSWPQSLRLMFPTWSSRLAAGLVLLVGVACVATWGALTIQRKWVGPREHPPTAISIESAQSLPAAEGMLSFAHRDTWFNRTIADTFPTNFINVSALPLDLLPPATGFPPPYQTPNTIPSHRYLWHAFHLSTGHATAGSGGAGSIKFVNQTELDAVYMCASSSGVLDITPKSYCLARDFASIVEQGRPWPLQFDSTLSRLCVRTYMLLDSRASLSLITDSARGLSWSFGAFQYAEPILQFSLVSLQDTYELYLRGLLGLEPATPANDAALYADPLILPYQHQHDVSLRMSKRVNLAGAVTWTNDLTFGGQRRVKPGVIARNFQDFYEANPSLLAELSADPNIELDPSRANFTTQYFAETCLSPSSFSVSVVREVADYGLLSFLGDLGGALNILAIIAAALFPLRYAMVQPRMFLGVWIKNKITKCCNKGKH